MAGTKWTSCVLIGVFCICMTGCATFNMGVDKNPPQIKADGILNGYMAYNGFRPYDGNIFDAHILSDNGQPGEMVSINLWPVGGVGVGLVGARVKVLPFEIGLGVLGEYPEPENYEKVGEPEEKDKIQHEVSGIPGHLDNRSIVQELTDLKKALDEGAITEEEYLQLKQEMIDKWTYN